MNKSATFVLKDGNKKIKVKVYQGNNGQLAIMPEGYGDKTSPDGQGAPILLDFTAGEGKLDLFVWSDINKEDATHVIPLEMAKETFRAEEGEECPNCRNGTLALEDGRLVCQGECGQFFAP